MPSVVVELKQHVKMVPIQGYMGHGTIIYTVYIISFGVG